jgi:hypothetical protein
MGINRLIYHTFAHKPFSERYRPGMTMGPYGVHWDRGQTWWSMVYEYHRYISRCQYILSQGKPVADILYLSAEGAPHVFRPPSDALTGSANMPDKQGYSFDGCSPEFLINNAGVKDGRIVFPGGSEYQILVLPDMQTMTLALLEKLKSLTEAGATITGNPPMKSPSLAGFPECDQKIAEMAKEIWGSVNVPEKLSQHQYGKGIIWWGKELVNPHRNLHNDPDSLSLYPEYSLTEKLLNEKGIKPDFIAGANIRYTHRSMADRDIYFISNRTGNQVNDTCYFRDGGKSAELWDAVTGKIRPLYDLISGNAIIGVPAKLDPYQSFFIVFHKTGKSNNYRTKDSENFPENEVLMTLDGPWNLAFDTLWGGPAKIEFEKLTDWSKRPEEGIKFYSGKAVYSKTFNIPESVSSAKKSNIYLNLGKVKNIASVKLNNKYLGVIWTDPWQVNISDAIRKGNNKLEITVINLWINRLIGDESEPWDGIENGKWPKWFLNGTGRPSKRYTFTTHHYYKKGDPLVESGLIGPVRIEILK